MLQQVSAAFEAQGDTDWFRVRLIAGQTYELRVDIPGVELSIVTPDGQVMRLPIPFTNYACFVAPVTGDFFVSATATSPNMFYTLTMQDMPDSIPASIATSWSIAPGETLTIPNSYQFSNNRDWLAIDVVAGQSYVLASSQIGTKLYVVDSDGVVQAIEGYGGNGGQQVHFTATETGRFYAVTERHSGLSYDLTFLAIADDHGDTPGAAGAVAVGGSVGGRWESGGDDDAYAIELQAGASYLFSLSNTSSFVSTTIAILDAGGATLWSSQNSVTSLSAVFSPTAGGTYYVSAGINAVSSPDPQHPSYLTGWDYTLSAALVAGDLTDNVLTTGQLAVGGQTAGTWNGPADADWMRIELVAGQSYRFTLTTSAWTKCGLALYAADGHIVGDPGFTVVGGAVLHLTAPTTGSYFLGALIGNATGTYTVAAAAVADDYANNVSTTGIAVAGIVQGVWEASGDSDWFAMSLVAGQTYRLNNGSLRVHDADGQLLTLSDHLDNSFTPSASGTYYLEAAGDAGAYSFAVVAAYDDHLESAATNGVMRVKVTGTEGADVMTGTDAHEWLSGGDGDDLFIAGTGYDYFEGGAGVDTLSYAESTTALDVDLGQAQSFADGVRDDLISQIENIVGTVFDDRITGSSAANRLDGGGGADILSGAAGDDRYVVDDPGDQVIEAPNQGNDTVLTGVDYALAAGASIEALIAADPAGTAPIDLSGNELANTLRGNAGFNRLAGGGGSDIFVFAALADSHGGALRSDGKKLAPDQIGDFETGIDRIDLSAIDARSATGANDAFTFIGSGAFTGLAGQLRCDLIGKAMHIYGDVDGNGIADFEIVAMTPILQATDFIL